MKYQVGRACAVAGYVDLFHKLHLLSESHITEEARDNKQWEIHEAIMKPEVRYNAMDDCTRTVLDKPVRGSPNGDTAVQSFLDIKTKFAKPPDSDAEIWELVSVRRRAYFDITEDDRVDEYGSKQLQPVEDDVSHLLYTPVASRFAHNEQRSPDSNDRILRRYRSVCSPTTVTEILHYPGNLPQHHVRQVVPAAESSQRDRKGDQRPLHHE